MITDAQEAGKYNPKDSPWLFRKDGRPLAPAPIGKIARQRLEQGITGLDKLIEKVKAAHRNRGHIVSLDGRLIKTRSEHSALNTLLQSFGAVVMKHALALFHTELAVDAGYVSSDFLTCSHFGYVANVHDEFEVEAEEEHAEPIGKLLQASIRLAGERLKSRCPLSGTYAIGNNWYEVH